MGHRVPFLVTIEIMGFYANYFRAFTILSLFESCRMATYACNENKMPYYVTMQL